MFEQLGLDGWTPRAASVVLGLVIGALFGVLAQRSRFCLRRGLVGDASERSAARGTWLIALAVAVAGTAVLTSYGLLSFSDHRFHAASLPVGALIVGGLMFGAGMYLARGCASRLTVLAGSGNLRAVAVLIVFAITAHAALKGALAPVTTGLAAFEIDLGTHVSLAQLPGGTLVWAALIAIGLVAVAVRSGASPRDLAFGGAIGALIPIAWLGTGFVLADEFDPIRLESLAFTSSATETVFWWMAGTAIEPGFGVGFFGGVLAGSVIAALASREFRWVGFGAGSGAGTGRYLAGGMLMGLGGVLAGGCTVGAGLSGVATLSFAAILALVSIVTGALMMQRLAQRTPAAAMPLPAE